MLKFRKLYPGINFPFSKSPAGARQGVPPKENSWNSSLFFFFCCEIYVFLFHTKVDWNSGTHAEILYVNIEYENLGILIFPDQSQSLYKYTEF